MTALRTAQRLGSIASLRRLSFWLAFGAFAALAAAAVFLSWDDHEVHILGALPWLLVFACPLLHVLVHRERGVRVANTAVRTGSVRH